MAEKQRYIIEAVDKFSKQFKNLDKKLASINKNFKKTGESGTTSAKRIIKHYKDVDGKLTKTVSRVRGLDGTIRETTKNFKKIKTPNIGKGMGISSFFLSNFKQFSVLAGAYAALRFGKTIFDTAIEMENIQATMGAVTKRFAAGKSTTAAIAEEMSFLKRISDELGISFQETVKPYAKFMAASRFGLKDTREVFKSFAKMGRVFGLKGPELGGIIKALEQMQSKGTVMAEELRLQLGDRMPGAVKLFADAAGVSTKEFLKLMEQGRISANIIKLVAKQIEKEYGGTAEIAMKSFGAEVARLGNKWFEFKTNIAKDSSGALRGIVKGLGSLIDGLQRVADSDSFSTIGNSTKELGKRFEKLKLGGIIVKGIFVGLFDVITHGIDLAIKGISVFLDAFSKMGEGISKVIQFIPETVGLIQKIIPGGKEPFEFKQHLPGPSPFEGGASASGVQEILNLTSEGANKPKQSVDINVLFDNLPNGAQTELSTPDPNTTLNVGTNFSPAF